MCATEPDAPRETRGPAAAAPPRQGGSQRGSLIIGVLAFVIMVSAFLLSAQHGVVTDTDAASRVRTHTQAFYVAESGIQYSIAEARMDSSWTGLASPGRNTMEGNFTVSVVRTDATGAALPASQKRYISTGTVGTATAQVSMILQFN